jgi:hypothetical protein
MNTTTDTNTMTDPNTGLELDADQLAALDEIGAAEMDAFFDNAE